MASEIDRKARKPFSFTEDHQLRVLVAQKGVHAWAEISKQMPGRSARQCRERWALYLSPDVSNAPWTPDDELKLLDLYSVLGPRWTLIAKGFPCRNANNVKNKLRQCLRRTQRLMRDNANREIDVSTAPDPLA